MNNVHERVEALEKRMAAVEHHLSDLRPELSANTEATLRVESNTRELVELMKIAKSGVGFFATTGRVLRRLAIWAGPFIALGSFIWAIMHGRMPGGNP